MMTSVVCALREMPPYTITLPLRTTINSRISCQASADSTLLLNPQMRCHLRGNKQACWLYNIYCQKVLLRQINDQPNTNSPFFVLSVFIVRFNPSTAENRCSAFLQNLLIGSISFVSRLLAPMSGLLIFVSLICVTLCKFY